RTTIEPALGRQWNRTALWLIVGIAAAAALLPIGSTFALAQILQFLILIIVGIVQVLFFILVFLLNLPLSLLARDTGNSEPELIEPPDLSPPDALFVPPPLVEAGPNLVANGLFWLVIVVVTLAAVAFFLLERGFSLPTGRLSRWWGAM